MAKMGRTERIIWGKWDCTSCDTKGISAEPPPGENQPVCPTCGNPREQNAKEAAYLDNKRDHTGRVLDANVADTQEELDIATAGPDWDCKNCGGDNRARETNCHGCGSPRYEPVNPEPPSPPTYELPPSTPEKVEGEREAVRARADRERILTRELAERRRRAREDEEAFEETERDRRQKEQNFKTGITVAGLGAVAVLVVGGIIWAFQAHDVGGRVTSMAWEHRVDRQTYTMVSREDWEKDISGARAVMPRNGSGESAGEFDVRGCHDKHYDDKKVKCGTERKCEDKQERDGETCKRECDTKSQSNGSFKEVCDDVCTPKYKTVNVCKDVDKFCNEPIYKEWCTYSTYEWQGAGTKNLGGGAPTTNPLPWPTIETGPLDRLVRHETYRVNITYNDGDGPETYTETAPSETSFHTWAIGEEVAVSVRNMGTVAEVRRKK